MSVLVLQIDSEYCMQKFGSAPHPQQRVPTARAQCCARRIHFQATHFVLVRPESDGAVLVPVQHVPGNAVAVVVASEQHASGAAHVHRRHAADDRRFRETAEFTVGTEIKQSAGAVVWAGDEPCAVAQKFHRIDVALVRVHGLSKRLYRRGHALVEHAGVGVARTGDKNVRFSRGGRERHHVTLVAAEPRNLVLGLNVPQNACCIPWTRQDLRLFQKTTARHVPVVADLPLRKLTYGWDIVLLIQRTHETFGFESPVFRAYAGVGSWKMLWNYYPYQFCSRRWWLDHVTCQRIHRAAVIQTPAGYSSALTGLESTGHDPWRMHRNNLFLGRFNSIPDDELAVLRRTHDRIGVRGCRDTRFTGGPMQSIYLPIVASQRPPYTRLVRKLLIDVLVRTIDCNAYGRWSLFDRECYMINRM